MSDELVFKGYGDGWLRSGRHRRPMSEEQARRLYGAGKGGYFIAVWFRGSRRLDLVVHPPGPDDLGGFYADIKVRGFGYSDITRGWRRQPDGRLFRNHDGNLEVLPDGTTGAAERWEYQPDGRVVVGMRPAGVNYEEVAHLGPVDLPEAVFWMADREFGDWDEFVHLIDAQAWPPAHRTVDRDLVRAVLDGPPPAPA